jgi:hypothetical protein
MAPPQAADADARAAAAAERRRRRLSGGCHPPSAQWLPCCLRPLSACWRRHPILRKQQSGGCPHRQPPPPLQKGSSCPAGAPCRQGDATAGTQVCICPATVPAQHNQQHNQLVSAAAKLCLPAIACVPHTPSPTHPPEVAFAVDAKVGVPRLVGMQHELPQPVGGATEQGIQSTRRVAVQVAAWPGVSAAGLSKL